MFYAFQCGCLAQNYIGILYGTNHIHRCQALHFLYIVYMFLYVSTVGTYIGTLDYILHIHADQVLTLHDLIMDVPYVPLHVLQAGIYICTLHYKLCIHGYQVLLKMWNG